MNASELIKNIRVQTGLSQEDFARAIHVSYGMVRLLYRCGYGGRRVEGYAKLSILRRSCYFRPC